LSGNKRPDRARISQNRAGRGPTRCGVDAPRLAIQEALRRMSQDGRELITNQLSTCWLTERHTSSGQTALNLPIWLACSLLPARPWAV